MTPFFVKDMKNVHLNFKHFLTLIVSMHVKVLS
jgi:hypothetical protein